MICALTVCVWDGILRSTELGEGIHRVKRRYSNIVLLTGITVFIYGRRIRLFPLRVFVLG